MKKTYRELIGKHLIRPIVYMSFTRLILCLTAALLWNEFVSPKGAISMRTYAFVILGVFLLAMGWMAYLRLSGVKLPVLDKRLFEWKRKPKRSYGDMIDHVDEDVISFDDLEEDERNFCRMTANLFCGVVFVVLSMV